ncbi:MAG: Uncharacterised protein [Flavobacterium sp. SCGC AAA160-P02]|nr:MAG: Uncharacterised protein [Flavobacterium sp. SCGC AAA160-P02]
MARFFFTVNFDFPNGLISLHTHTVEMSQKNNGNNKMYHKFILFMILSIVFWFMTKLSKEYESTIEYPVSYKNFPEDKLLQEEPQKIIKIHIKASGFKLISATFFPKELEINASNLYSKSSTDYYLLLSQQRLAIQKQMKKGLEIDHFINDSILFSLGLLNRKKVPVKLLSEITYAAGYELNENLAIVPDSVVISGPESILDTIGFVTTELLQKKKINTSIKETLKIKRFNPSTNVKFKQKNVMVSALVERFTEGTLEVPFKVLNIPDTKIINTFPKVVKITYKVALSNFNKIDISSFLIECDYKTSQENNLSYLIPKLMEKSSMVKQTRISPLKIDYIINK